VTLTPQLSFILNVLRFFAAFVVVVCHSNLLGFGESGAWLGKYGHTMVILFFVMSGFIISRTTMDAHLDLKKYAIYRVSRVYTVALPAIALSAVLSGFWSEWLAPDDSFQYPDFWTVIRSVLFLEHSWRVGNGMSLNPPFWSLCYEVWYYVLFAAVFFLAGWTRLIWASAILLIMGPALWALIPAWLIGVYLCRCPVRISNARTNAALALGCILVVIAIVELGFDTAIQKAMADRIPQIWHLGFSTKFLTDNVIAALFALSFWFCAGMRFSMPPACISRAATILAGFSFTLYLFHDPLLRLIKLASDQYVYSLPEHWLVVFAVVLTCWLISLLTENHTWKVRKFLQGQFSSPARV
jgi:peptidoglycan/LPS O-acetylase OafA/YrhL